MYLCIVIRHGECGADRDWSGTTPSSYSRPWSYHRTRGRRGPARCHLQRLLHREINALCTNKEMLGLEIDTREQCVTALEIEHGSVHVVELQRTHHVLGVLVRLDQRIIARPKFTAHMGHCHVLW